MDDRKQCEWVISHWVGIQLPEWIPLNLQTGLPSG
jgi:hypothetical protein